jgi:hypothetical protein
MPKGFGNVQSLPKGKIEILKIRNGYPACSVWGCKDVSVNGTP